MIYLLSEQRLKADFLNDNIASELILPSIQTAQDIYLRQTLGDSLLDKICCLVRENELEEPYKTLLDEYIIIYLEYLAMAELCVPSTFKLGNIGVAQNYDSNVNTQTIQNVKYLESYYKQKASFYENRLTTFIQKHYNLYPEYNTVSDVTVSSESTLQCGIYLGGTTKKKIITNNNSNNTNTDVGNYVRYDKAQNLTELEKQQARENIGVSANGDIVVDLENYYTKDEIETNYYTKNETYSKQQVNTKINESIENCVTDTELNTKLGGYYTKSQTDTAIQNAIENADFPDTDLSNYYTKTDINNNYYSKETINNMIDTLPIPERTSELVKDDVYTKSEVYTKGEVDIKIANVSSGGSVDLSNYYNKQETESYVENAIADIEIPTKTSQLELDNTYSKTQVDTLISNVPTFSGDYEDLSNKPSIYTKNEIDTLISNINEFSGDYNDLTNKPDVYTKSQTDTAIQNAVDGIETFSGNYNDLTNKPTLFSGSYTDLSDKPTIPTDTAQLTKSDIYTKAETFTRDEIVSMINEINYSDINNIPTLSTVATSGNYGDLNNLPTLFSGSYTDLTNTPEIYTKSEIDLQIAEINTTLGNINNILETI